MNIECKIIFLPSKCQRKKNWKIITLQRSTCLSDEKKMFRPPEIYSTGISSYHVDLEKTHDMAINGGKKDEINEFYFEGYKDIYFFIIESQAKQAYTHIYKNKICHCFFPSSTARRFLRAKRTDILSFFIHCFFLSSTVPSPPNRCPPSIYDPFASTLVT